MNDKKKLLSQFHQNNIIASAENLFKEKGINKTTMDDIAKDAEYSKATIYVYFKNKEDIINRIVLKSMELLYEHIKNAVSEEQDIFQKYYSICNEFVWYKNEYPLYYETILNEINIDIDNSEFPLVLSNIFDVGEKINLEIGNFLKEGIMQGVIRNDICISQMIFIFWGSISGIINIAYQKQKYIEKILGKTKENFLKYSFETLFKSILK